MSPFGALLRRWRSDRRWSQLELSSAADVSARHVSFLESGRASPSREMVLRLAGALDVPLRAQNELLEAAGFRAEWRPGAPSSPALSLDPLIERVVERMMEKHDPWPLVVFDRRFDVVRANRGAVAMLAALLGQPPPAPINVLALVFDDAGLRPFIEDWDRVATVTLALARRELVRCPDEALGLRVRALARRGFDAGPDVELPAAFPIRFVRDDVRAAFVTTLTTFSAPATVVADELRIESYFPIDDATEALCRRLAGHAVAA